MMVKRVFFIYLRPRIAFLPSILVQRMSFRGWLLKRESLKLQEMFFLCAGKKTFLYFLVSKRWTWLNEALNFAGWRASSNACTRRGCHCAGLPKKNEVLVVFVIQKILKQKSSFGVNGDLPRFSRVWMVFVLVVFLGAGSWFFPCCPSDILLWFYRLFSTVQQGLDVICLSRAILAEFSG